MSASSSMVGSGKRCGSLAREELFAGWRLFFERLAAVRPVVLMVEDAQYADAGLLDFLEYLIDWVRDLPIYVLARDIAGRLGCQPLLDRADTTQPATPRATA